MKVTRLLLILILGIGLLSACAPPAAPPPDEASPSDIGEGPVILQKGNDLPITQLQPKQSAELEDNRIGGLWSLKTPNHYGDPNTFFDDINELGLKRIRLTIDHRDWPEVDWGKGGYSEYHVESHQERTITGLANNNVKIMYSLVFWDPESPGQKEEEGYSRFNTENEIQRYLDYVEFIVGHFKGRIEYYEILNEPNIGQGTQQYVELEDYINLVKRVVPVIRQEQPEAKMVAGSTASFREENTKEYLFGLLNSEVMSLVDGISFHPLYGTSPEYDTKEKVFAHDKQYYYEYPSLIREIRKVASAHGFNGEYVADELTWRAARNPNIHEPWTYSETVAAKYYARGILINLGLDVTVGLGGLEPDKANLPKMKMVQNLCTIMAGAEPISLPIDIQSKATNIVTYGFSLPKDDKLVALWTDGVAVDNDPGVNTTLTLPGFSAQKVMGMDVLNGFERELVTSVEGGNLVIRDLLVKDYPIILRLTP